MGVDTIADVAKNLNTESIFAIFNTGLMAKVYFFLKIGFWMTVFMFGAMAIYKYFLQFKIKVTVVKKIGLDSTETYSDMAKFVTDEQNKPKLILFKTRKTNKKQATCPLPPAEFKGKCGRKDHYFMFMDDNGELHPIDPPMAEENFGRMKIRPSERDAWRRMEDDILLKKYRKKDKLLQYATPAILMTACITAFLIFFFASKEIGAGMQSLAASFLQVASSCTQLG